MIGELGNLPMSCAATTRTSQRPRKILFAAAVCCIALMAAPADAQVNWKRVGVVSTLTNGQLCKTDGTYVICDSTTPTISGGAVGIGTTSPNASALLDVYSTTQGLLPPRMTTTQRNAISSPAMGLTIYKRLGLGCDMKTQWRQG
jgi:hypothetical protein